MRILLVTLLLLVLNTVNAQDAGIQFQQCTDWEDILAKAQAAHKDIFIDCYTTWCGPCKKMDREVYTDSAVGNYFNSRYISFKIQMDSTGKDDNYVKSLYKTAKKIESENHVAAFPSYLFFSANGELLHRSIGFKNTKDLVSLAADAKDPSKQYPKRVMAFQSGNLPFQDLLGLARQAGQNGDAALEKEIANYYKTHYLDTCSKQVLFEKGNLSFLVSNPNVITSHDRIFSYGLKTEELPDSIDKDGLKGLVSNVITREEITDLLWHGDTVLTLKPDWKKISSSITKKYGASYTESLLSGQQQQFYSRTGNWKEYANVVEARLSKKPLKPGNGDYSWDMNNYAWELFVLCKDQSVLKKALAWSDKSISAMGDKYPDVHNFYDTRANLQYKLGMRDKALKDEQKAIELSGALKSDMKNAYLETKSKMEKSIPTWD
jgi:thioredoxin-related protein